MAWQDRPYYRDRSDSTRNPLVWLVSGSIPLFTLFGIRVRAHASLIVLIALVLLFGFGGQTTVEMRVQSMSILFLVVLLHEFGHCFGARWTGGEADEILMTPLGGLAMAMARRRPWPTFVTVAAGPLVNVAICLVCSLGLLFLAGYVPFLPNSFKAHLPRYGWFNVINYLYWFYLISLGLLIFNILPVFPLDGGQLLQSILWKPMGYYKSMLLTVNIGLVGSVLMGMVGIAMMATGSFGLLILLIAISCFVNCFKMRAMMRAEGPWGFQEEDTGFDYGASLRASTKTTRR